MKTKRFLFFFLLASPIVLVVLVLIASKVYTRDLFGACRDCNVILISIDTLRADHVGCYGYSRDTTPNIDEVARDALVFKNAISQSSWTAPAHASMMTGLVPSEHGLIFFRKPGKLDKDYVTLAEILSRAGYTTVSYNGGGYVSNHFGIGRGFEVYRSMSRSFNKNIKAAEQFLNEHPDERFFLFLHGYDVHRPYDKTDYNYFYEYNEDYDILTFCDDKNHRKYKDADELRYIISQYDAGILYADELLGGFFSYLKTEGLYDRSLIIITSDHGEEFFEHGLCDHKHSLYEELIRVPLIVKLPTNIRGSIEWPLPASTTLLPTIIDLLGMEKTVSSKESIVRRLKHLWPSSLWPVASETGYNVKGTEYQKSLTIGSGKLILRRKKNRSVYEYYQLDSDPAEKNNLISKSPKAADDLKAPLLSSGYASTLATISDVPAGKDDQKIEDKELIEQLKALGYVENE